MAKEYGEFGVGLRVLLVVMGIKWDFQPPDKTENLGLLNSSWHVPKIKIIIDCCISSPVYMLDTSICCML